MAARIVSPPGPDGMLAPRHGAWMGLAGTLLVALGAWWASVPARTAPAPPAPAAFADARATGDSIAPPLP